MDEPTKWIGAAFLVIFLGGVASFMLQGWWNHDGPMARMVKRWLGVTP